MNIVEIILRISGLVKIVVGFVVLVSINSWEEHWDGEPERK